MQKVRTDHHLLKITVTYSTHSQAATTPIVSNVNNIKLIEQQQTIFLNFIIKVLGKCDY